MIWTMDLLLLHLLGEECLVGCQVVERHCRTLLKRPVLWYINLILQVLAYCREVV